MNRCYTCPCVDNPSTKANYNDTRLADTIVLSDDTSLTIKRIMFCQICKFNCLIQSKWNLLLIVANITKQCLYFSYLTNHAINFANISCENDFFCGKKHLIFFLSISWLFKSSFREKNATVSVDVVTDKNRTKRNTFVKAYSLYLKK